MEKVSKEEEIADFKILEQILIKEAQEYLTRQVLSELRGQMREIAVNAVKTWAEYRLEKVTDSFGFESNININFIEHIIKTQVKDRVVINVKDK